MRFRGIARYDEMLLDKAYVASARHTKKYFRFAFRQFICGAKVGATFFEGAFAVFALRENFRVFKAVDRFFEAELPKPKPEKRYEHEQCASRDDVRFLSTEEYEVVCRMSRYGSCDGSQCANGVGNSERYEQCERIPLANGGHGHPEKNVEAVSANAQKRVGHGGVAIERKRCRKKACNNDQRRKREERIFASWFADEGNGNGDGEQDDSLKRAAVWRIAHFVERKRIS